MIGRLTKRSEFLTVRNGLRAAKPLVVVQALKRAPEGEPRVGFTATKKIGNAVVRNRAKRRLREAARQALPEAGVAGCDYVLIARDDTAGAPWPRLLDDVRSALLRLRPALAEAKAATALKAPRAPPPETE